MILINWGGRMAGQMVLTLAATLGLASASYAQTHEYALGNIGSAVPIEQADPEYPGHKVRSGQEGWVRMHFVVAPDGRASDPIIIDSSGGVGFEEEARKVMTKWRFEAPASGTELPNNIVNIRSEYRRGRDAATSNFIRRYRRIVTHLHHEEYDTARKQVDEAYELGGWNLYESAMLWLMLGRVDGAEGNLIGKLENYHRALSVGTRKSLSGKDRRELLSRIFELEDRYGLYANASRTFALLEKDVKSRADLAEFAERATAIKAMMKSEETLSANATIYNPCDCDSGEPLWYYRPARRTFSFANLNGNVQRFEARCENHRIRDDVVEGKSWTLAPDWGSCRVFVFGDDGATFDFLEHLSDNQDESTGGDAVARSHVLD